MKSRRPKKVLSRAPLQENMSKGRLVFFFKGEFYTKD